MKALPDNSDPYLLEARQRQLFEIKNRSNLLSMLTEISDDLSNMELTQSEKELFELGMYLAVTLGRISNN